MTKDDIIRMAIEAELVPDAIWDTPELERFAALVAAAEREACAKVCNDLYPHSGYHPALRKAAGNCAASIRARSQQTGVPS